MRRARKKNDYALPRERIRMPNPRDGSDAYGLQPGAHLVPVMKTRRVAQPEPLTKPESVARFLGGLGKSPVERFVTIPLDAHGRPLGAVIASSGTVNETFLHPREVFAPAIEARAAAVIVAHNHPSGNRAPSAQDAEVTRRLLRASKIVGIPLLDHVIIPGDGTATSLRRERDDLWSQAEARQENPPRRNRARRRPRLTAAAEATIARWAATNPRRSPTKRLKERIAEAFFDFQRPRDWMEGQRLREAADDVRYWREREKKSNPARSAAQRRLFGAALGCRRTGRCASDKVRRLARLPEATFRAFARNPTAAEARAISRRTAAKYLRLMRGAGRGKRARSEIRDLRRAGSLRKNPLDWAQIATGALVSGGASFLGARLGEAAKRRRNGRRR